MSTLREMLTYEPVELNFGTSGLRGLVVDMTDLECYVNTRGFLQFLREVDHLQSGATVYLAGDLRDSTPQIMRAVQAAIEADGYVVNYVGLIPTPALALYALNHKAPGIMVTGSHIPADRNGIKFYKRAGEVLKEDESAIKAAVAEVRAQLYVEDGHISPFTSDGRLKQSPELPPVNDEAAHQFVDRFTSVFSPEIFRGKKIVFYQHSAVGRDLIADIFTRLGAELIVVGRSDTFIPIDSENVTPENRAYFRQLAEENPGVFAIVSTDGDSDRPFLIDETGTFHLGDVLGAVVAEWLETDFAAFTANAGDAVLTHLTSKGIEFGQTKLGSPYVISLMNQALRDGKQRPVGWEVNGGFLTGVDLTINGQLLQALPTRDATLPILVTLVAAVEGEQKVSDIFSKLPRRFSANGLINNFPVDVAKKITQHFAINSLQVQEELKKYFTPQQGFGTVREIITLDGVRLIFDNGDIAHIRQSGNAPQFRMYSFADNQERANEIVALAIAEPDGIFRRMEQAFSLGSSTD